MSWPVSENGRASRRELSMMNPKLPWYGHLPGARLLPNAGSWLKGELAALLTLPLTRKPSAARRASSDDTCADETSTAGTVDFAAVISVD